MSATIDSDKFSSYFQHCPVYHIPGRTFPVEVGAGITLVIAVLRDDVFLGITSILFFATRRSNI